MEIRTAFHKQLRIIQDDLLNMGSMTEKAITQSVKALKERDIKLAKQIIDNDKKINRSRFEIEEVDVIPFIASTNPPP